MVGSPCRSVLSREPRLSSDGSGWRWSPCTCGVRNARRWSDEASTVESPSRKPNGRVGERSPHRDEVGKTQTLVSPTHCAFSGLIELDAFRLVQSMIQEVQCP